MTICLRQSPNQAAATRLPDPEEFAKKLCAWGVGVNKQVVVYDDSFGAMAVRMWWMLRWLGTPVLPCSMAASQMAARKAAADMPITRTCKGRLRLLAGTHADCRRR
jgi:hypothetical protein